MVLQGLNNNHSDLFDPRNMLDAKSSKCASHLQEGSAAHLAVSHRAYHLCFFSYFQWIHSVFTQFVPFCMVKMKLPTPNREAGSLILLSYAP